MGSSAPQVHFYWILIAVASGVVYLAFDALRSLAMQIGPVRLRRLSGPDESKEGSTRFDVEDFQLVSGAILQIALIAGAASTAMLLVRSSFTTAVLLSAGGWMLGVLLWKLLIALVPEETGEIVVQALFPIARASYFLFWPFLYPLRRFAERLSSRNGEKDEEEEVTAAEVQAYIDVGEEEGIIEPAEGKLLQSIVDFGDRLAHEIMTPRIDVLAFDAKRPIDELAKLFSESKYARIPIYEKSIDQITGIVHIKDLFDTVLRSENKTVQELARPPYFVSETKKVSELLRELQSEHLQIAVVVDEYGGTAGIITTEDVIEEIVGEIADEHEDEEATLVEMGEDAWMVSGQMRVQTLEETLDAKLAGDDYETVAGLIFTSLGRVPGVGARVEKNGFSFEVERADRRRIYRVRIARIPGWDADAASAEA